MIEFLLVAWVISGVWMFLRVMGKGVPNDPCPWQFAVFMGMFFFFWPITFLLSVLADWYDWVNGETEFFVMPMVWVMLKEGAEG